MLEKIKCMNKSKAQLSAVVLRVEQVFKGYLQVEPPKNFLEKYKVFEQVKVIIVELVQALKSRNSKSTNPNYYPALLGHFCLSIVFRLSWCHHLPSIQLFPS